MFLASHQNQERKCLNFCPEGVIFIYSQRIMTQDQKNLSIQLANGGPRCIRQQNMEAVSITAKLAYYYSIIVVHKAISIFVQE